MFDFFRSALDVILPRRERIARADAYTLEDLAISPVEHEARGVRITTLMSYKTKAVEDLVQALKYDGTGRATRLLAEALAEYLREEIAQIKLFSSRSVILVPVPLHKNRLRERGFNQIERVLGKLPYEFSNGRVSRIVSDALVRTRDTMQQTRLSRKERLANVAGAFSLIKPELIQNTNVILIDDVTTTGATLIEAAKACGGLPVFLLALSHA